MEKPLDGQQALDSSNSSTPSISSPLPEPTTKLESLRARTRPLAFAVICGSLTLDSFNVTGLTYGQLNIAEHYDVIVTTASWSLSAYSLAFGSLLLIAGRAGDMYGHKQVYSYGLIFFSVFALLAASIDSNFVALCIFRALQGASAACTVPTAYAMVGIRYKGQAREMAVAGLGVSSTTGAIMGSIIGGAFANTGLGYRGTLWLSFGISIVLCALAFLLLEPTPRDPSIEKKPLDVIGSFLVTAACAILVYGFTEAPTGWDQAKVIAPIIIGVALLVSFFIFEQFVVWKFMPKVDPLIPTRVWKYSNLVPLTIQTGLIYGCFFLSVLNGSTFLLRVQERKPLISAVMWSPLIIGTLIFCILMGPFYNHRYMPPKWFLVFGSLVLATGVSLFSRNNLETGYWRYTFSGSIVMSLGTAIFFVHYLNVAYAATPPEDQGLVSGIIQTSAQVATALGLAIGSSFLSSETPKGLLPEYRNSFYVAIAFGCAGAIVALVLQSCRSTEIGGLVLESSYSVELEELGSYLRLMHPSLCQCEEN
ncbi:major facilitator superfamily domain-containing protein [Leptodontidium sp. MPI-SDFR-AT-0119]|nr:major facilitator superfamily domain-containing protein [Leptodontidium sp. MPI-SDFR-AT-0119]